MFGIGKIKCSKCGIENDKNDRFCCACGSNLTGAVCSGCGAKIGPGDKFCPECGSSIKPAASDLRSKATPAQPLEESIKMWTRQPADFARRFELEDIKGTFRKHITIEQGTKAIFLQGGKFLGELLPGNYDTGGLLHRIGDLNISEKATVIVLDGSDTRLNFKIGSLRTKEAFDAGVRGTITLNVENPILFFTNLMKSRDYISLGDLNEHFNEEMTNVVQAKIKQYSFDELYGNLAIKKEIQQDFEHHMRTTLNRLGMNLIHLPNFDYDESYWTEIIKRKGGVGKGGQIENIKDDELELRNRERARAAGEDINKLKNEDEIKKFIHELAKQGIIRDYDKIELQHILQENLQDLGMVRNQIREKLAHTHGIDMQRGSLGFEVEAARERDRLKDEMARREIERERIEGEQGINLLDKLKTTKRADAAGYQKIEEERLKARSGATDEALISTIGEGGGHPAVGTLGDLAKMKVSKGLTPEQILALQAKDSAGVAKAFEAKFSAEKTEQLYRERMADQQKFQETMVNLTDKNADRAERMASKSMEQMGATAVTRGQAAVPTTTVVGGGGFGGAPVVVGAQGAPAQERKVVLCQGCNAENEVGA
ncbi:MAG: zinc ribbon domain-containing protein, partial [Euryarchaeota archaeon]|nr:zinc ribbon domain-containing protein [Euryarchaeota archaeon]